MNQWEAAKYFYDMRRDLILAGPRNEWVIDPYEWERFITLTPIEYWLWCDIRQANVVMYPQYPVDRFFVDFANPKAKVAIECDGAAFHTDKQKDSARDAKLEGLGWQIYRISGKACRTESDEETGEPGYARLFIDGIAERHGLKRDGRRKPSDETDCIRTVIDALLEANPQ